jgi:uncharacterized protein YfiM (DUF2279 family)
MFKTLPLILAFALPAYAEEPLRIRPVPQAPSSGSKDTWSGSDKKLHFAAGALVAGAVVGGTRHRGYGTAAGCAAGLGKELIDPVFSSKDLIATCIGALAGAYAAGWMLSRKADVTTVSYTWEY